MRTGLILALLPVVNGYCSAGNTVAGDSNLGGVTMAGVQGMSIADTTNCPGQIGMRDLTAQKAGVQPGGTNTLSFQATTCDTGWQRLAYAYIDFNNNGVYDPTELLGQQQVDNRLDPFNVEFPVHAPCVGEGSAVGTTRMRVFVVESGFTPNPCLTFAYGGVKEFSIQIVAEPGALCGGSDLSTGGGGGGTIFLIVLFVALFVYFTFSAVWVFKLHPEHADKPWFAPLKKEFWVNAVGLVKDGCIYTKTKCLALVGRARGRGKGYDTV